MISFLAIGTFIIEIAFEMNSLDLGTVRTREVEGTKPYKSYFHFYLLSAPFRACLYVIGVIAVEPIQGTLTHVPA